MLLRTGTPLDPSSVLGKIVRRMPLGIAAPAYANRIGLFWTYALAGSRLDRYIAYLKTRRYAVEQWLDADYRSHGWTRRRQQESKSELTQGPIGPLNDQPCRASY